MRKEDLMDILGDVDTDLIAEAAPGARRLRYKPLAIAAAAIVMLLSFTLGVLAAATTEVGRYIASVLENEEETTDPVFRPAENVVYDGQSDETSVTVTRIAGDIVSAFVYFELTLPAEVVEEYGDSKFYFREYDAGIYADEEATVKVEKAGAHILSLGFTDRPNTYLFALRCSAFASTDSLSLIHGNYADMQLFDVCVRGDEGEVVVASGAWSVRFPLLYRVKMLEYENLDVAGKVAVADREFTPEDLENYVPSICLDDMNARISTTSLRLEYEYSCDTREEWNKFWYHPHYIQVVLADGSTMRASFASSEGKGDPDTYRYTWVAHYRLEVPVDPETVVAIVYGGVTAELTEEKLTELPN